MYLISTGNKPGKGKYKDKVGALYCQMNNQQKLTIGSGLSDKQRLSTPPIGTRITFKYYGLTKNKKPRFPVFKSIRAIE
ncbi:MAG: hypothetical protein HQL46_12760 [Gammaproteobacteria bacterium]|nr:hypothetical protein [Gammaproteobacteria bacterium]